MALGINEVDSAITAKFEAWLESQDADGQPSGDDPSPQPPSRAKARHAAPDPEDDEQSAPEEEAQADDESEDEGAEAQAESEEADSEADDDAPIDTISDVARLFEVEEDDLIDHLRVDGIDGEQVSLRTVIDHYKQGPSMSAEMQAEVERQVAEKNAAIDTQMDTLQKATAQVLQRIQKRAANVDWERLKAEDPAAYIRHVEEQQADQREAQAAIEAMEAEQKRREDEAEKRHKAFVEEQGKLLVRLKPEWSDPEKAKVASNEIRSYMKAAGFKEEQIQQLNDAPSIITVWEAAQYRKSLAKKPEALERLRGVPKRSQLKATARREAVPNEARTKQRRDLLGRFRKSGRIEDAVDLFAEHLD